VPVPPSRFLPFLLLAAAASIGQTVLVDRVAASVNDMAIPESAVRRAMLLSPLEQTPGESPEAFRVRVLDGLVDQYLQYEDALRFGPEPPNAAETEAAMAKLRERLAAEGKDPAAEFARAGMTADDVRASLERQLVVQRYLLERFRPVALADEERARAEYEERYVPERRAAGLPVLPFEQVAGEMRAQAQQRGFDEEIEKWLSELREKARITIYPTPTAPTGQSAPTVIATAPPPTRTPTR
jgi:parvulin-like peptidyl-prolyl isomerase